MGKGSILKRPKPPEVRNIPLGKISVETRFQPRAGLNNDWVDECVELVNAGTERKGGLPIVYDTPDGLFLVDGFHWRAAHLKVCKGHMKCLVTPGTTRDALKCAVGANADHGLNRTAADKRNAIHLALVDEQLRLLPDTELAKLCRVNRNLVGDVRKERADKIGDEPPTTRLAKDGGAYTVRAKKTPPHPASAEDIAAREVQRAAHEQAEIDDVARLYVKAAMQGTYSQPPQSANLPAAAKDKKGRAIPEDLREVFAETIFTDHLKTLKTIRGDFEAFVDARSPQSRGVSMQSLGIAITELAGIIRSCAPYVVCPACGGNKCVGGLIGEGACLSCKPHGISMGFQTKAGFHRLSEELQERCSAYGPAEPDATD